MNDLDKGDTFIVKNNGKPYTDEVKADDVYIVVNSRHYDTTGNILNLRTGKVHFWRGSLNVKKVKVKATVEDM